MRVPSRTSAPTICVVIYAYIYLPIVSEPSYAETSQSPVSSDRAAQCRSLSDADFSTTPDAPTQISTAKVVDDIHELLGDLGFPTLPELVPLAIKHIGSVQPYCRVLGYVTPN